MSRKNDKNREPVPESLRTVHAPTGEWPVPLDGTDYASVRKWRSAVLEHGSMKKVKYTTRALKCFVRHAPGLGSSERDNVYEHLDRLNPQSPPNSDSLTKEKEQKKMTTKDKQNGSPTVLKGKEPGQTRKRSKRPLQHGSTPASTEQSSTSSTVLNVQTLPIGQIHPNDYNPNEMSDEGLQQLVSEVKRLGHLPKPLVVRELDEGKYEIVDGAHGHHAACKLGHTEVPCEVIDADDFEAMLQNDKRNRHGKMNPVRRGRMFRAMMQEKKLSQRALAEAIDLSEATVRNYLQFAEAAEVRNGYAPDDADTGIAELKVKQVRHYLNLPEDERNSWLDEGAQLEPGSPTNPDSDPEQGGDDPSPNVESEEKDHDESDSEKRGTNPPGAGTKSPTTREPSSGKEKKKTKSGQKKSNEPNEDQSGGGGSDTSEVTVGDLWEMWHDATEEVQREFFETLMNEPGPKAWLEEWQDQDFNGSETEGEAEPDSVECLAQL